MKRYTGNDHRAIMADVLSDLDNGVFTQRDYEYTSKQAYHYGRNDKGESLMPECGIDNFHELVHAAHCVDASTIARWNKGFMASVLFGNGYADSIIEHYGVETCQHVAAWADKLPDTFEGVNKRFYKQMSANNSNKSTRPATAYTTSVVENLRAKKRSQ